MKAIIEALFEEYRVVFRSGYKTVFVDDIVCWQSCALLFSFFSTGADVNVLLLKDCFWMLIGL